MKKRLSVIIIIIMAIQLFPLGRTQISFVVLTPKVEIDERPPATKATLKEKKQNKAMAMSYASAGWGWDLRQRQCIRLIFNKESRFDHLAKNRQGSSAFGIGQVLKEKSKDPEIQVLRAYKYIVHRYRTPCNAWAFHQRNNWY